MLQLSDDSLAKIATCLNYDFENSTIRSFRKCCYRINDVVVWFNLHRGDGYELILRMSSSKRVMSTTIREVDWSSVLKTASETKTRSKKRHQTAELIVRKKYEATINDEAKILRTLLKKTKENLYSISFLRISNFSLDTKFLEVMKEYTQTIQIADEVYIDHCVMKWTDEELLQFLKIFKSLKTLELQANFENTTIINDTHLSLITNKIRIVQAFGGKTQFSGITPKIVDHWIQTNMKLISLEGISTRITYSDIRKCIDTKIANAQLTNDDGSFRSKSSTSNFGILKFCKNDPRKIALDQRKRGFDWEIVTFISVISYTVTGTGINYQFILNFPRQRIKRRNEQRRDPVDADLDAMEAMMDMIENEQRQNAGLRRNI